MIDPVNPNREFSFILDVIENKVYKGKLSSLSKSFGM